MNPKFASLLKLLIVSTLIGVTAGCASVQDAFAPGIVAQAKSAGSEAIAADNPALIPGSVDLGISKMGSQTVYNGALVPGSIDLSISKNGTQTTDNGALVPGSVDLSISNTGPRPAYSGALVPGSVDLSNRLGGALVAPTVYLSRFRR